MKVFLSWSGESSKHIAVSFRDWLPRFLQAVDPWISSHMDKGLVWDNEISKELNETKAGILFLTPDNLDSPYLHYEAGAISNVEGARVYTFLYNIDAINVKQPLSRFQNTKNDKSDILQLVQTINSKLKAVGETHLSEQHLESNFDLFYPLLEESLISTPAPGKAKPKRNEADILEEVLNAVRGLQKGTISNDLNDEQPTARRYSRNPLTIKDAMRKIMHRSGYENFRAMPIREIIEFLHSDYQLAASPISLIRNVKSDLINELGSNIDNNNFPITT